MREARRRQLEELRKRQVLEEAALTPAQRFERVEGLRAFAAASGAPASRTDESAEFLIRSRRERLVRFGRWTP